MDDPLRRGARRRAVRRADAGRRSRTCSTCSPVGSPPTTSPSCVPASPGTGWPTRSSPARARKRIAIVNGGTIPDRGLYGVFLAGGEKAHARVGELDEEMVFESKVGEVFLLGASSWRIEEITHDRVLVSPAPGQPGKMPFWHGDARGASARVGPAHRPAGARAPRGPARRGGVAAGPRSTSSKARPQRTSSSTWRTRRRAIGDVPDDRTLVVERTRDELGDWRVCVLSPLGGRVHAPWAMAADRARARAARARRRDDVDRRRHRGPLPGHGHSARRGCVAPLAGRGGGAGRAPARARRRSSRRSFRENASRALLLPRRRPGAADPALAAAEARRGSPRGGCAVPQLPAPARDLPRVPAGRVRYAGPGGHAAGGPRPRRCGS